MSSWLVALRIARRDARRSRGRSALVIAMIALPVLGVGAVDVAFRTFELSPEQAAVRELGQADASVLDSGQTKVVQDGGTGQGYQTEGDHPRPAGLIAEPLSSLPEGTRAVSDRSVQADLSHGDRAADAQLRELAYDEPVVKGIYRQRSGRAPRGPGETALSTALASRLGVHVGDQVFAPKGVALTVVGLLDDASTTDARAALIDPGWLPASGDTAQSRYLVKTPRPLVWNDVRWANAHGIVIYPRHKLPGTPLPSHPSGSQGGVRTLAIVVIVVGMALLEVVLLAGPAFAVGAKRRGRELALLAATGADRRDVRRAVLAGGLVLGAVGGVVGVALGTGLGALLVRLLGRLNKTVPGPFEARPIELLAIAAVGIVTALLAAVLPARTASRQDVVAALTGRRGAVRTRKRVPVLGVLAAVAGAVLAMYGAQRRDALVLLAGSAVAELGLVATTPALIGLVGRLGPLLSATPRLALRDAARNRARTAPVVAAVLAAVAGSTAVATYVASLDRYDENRYTPGAISRTAVVAFNNDKDRGRLAQVEAELRRTLPVTGAVQIRSVYSTSPDAPIPDVDRPVDKQCPLNQLDHLPTRADVASLRDDRRCRFEGGTSALVPPLVVGDAETAVLLTGVPRAEADRVLRAGGVLAPDVNVSSSGTVLITLRPSNDPSGTHGKPFRFAAGVLPDNRLGYVVLSPPAAARLGQTLTVSGLVAALSRQPTANERDRASAAVAKLGVQSTPYIERGYQGRYGPGLLALLIGSAILVLGASGIATGLAAADGRADLATLAAIGATPTVRRALAGFQSAITAGLGTLLGVIAGLVPAIGILRSLNSDNSLALVERHPLVLPWTNLLVTVLVVPLVAGLAAALLTRSRLPLVRRVA